MIISADGPGAGPVVAVTDLTVQYGAVVALRDVNLTLAGSRVCGLVGLNGSGKSTLFKSLVGLVRPQHGQILLLGEPPERARRRGTVAYVAQADEVDQTFPLSVADVVVTGRYAHLGPMRRPRLRDRELVAAALARVELTQLADRPIGQLSGGQRKRVFIARALVQQAPLLLLDEPFAGVDRRSEQLIIDVLRELAAAGVTSLVATHDLNHLDTLCDEVVLLQQRVLVHDRPEVVLQPDQLARAFGLDVSTAPVATPSAKSQA